MGKASDNAYHIVGELNKKRRHIEVKENNKNVAHGPFVHYVLSDDSKLDGKQKTEALASVLYIPSTGQYFPMISAKFDMVKCYLKANYDATLLDFIPLQPLPSSDL